MDTVETPPPPPSPGQLLAHERESRGWSRTEVAQRLHMSASQIEALEADDYSRLPKGPFLRGFVRNYAKLLGLEPEPVIARLAEAAPSHAAQRIVVPSQNIRFEPLRERISTSPYVKGGLIAAVVLAFGFAVMYWAVYVRTTPPVATVKKAEPGPPQQIAAAPVPAPEVPPPVPAPTEAVPAADVKAEPARAEAPKAEAAKAEPPKAEPPKAEAPKAPAPRVADAGKSKTLRFRFRGESWVEIKDGEGKVILSRLNPKDTEAEVSGRPPFQVIVGNAPDVTMLYNDREFPLEPHTRVAVARFTVE